jgi:3-isopropylmalate/(R)-2-methylmalate dehydratase small subunit
VIPFETVVSPAASLMQPNVDTDVITPMRRISQRGEKPLSYYAFEALRYLGGDGDEGDPDPDFCLNQERFAAARILITGENFGCGSSRETAPRAIGDLGIRVLVGASFGDIFFNNCFQCGILPIRLDAGVVDRLVGQAQSGADFRVDLEAQTITAPAGEVVAFEVDPLRRGSLLAGLDDIGMTLELADRIGDFQSRDRRERPWVWSVTARSVDTRS